MMLTKYKKPMMTMADADTHGRSFHLPGNAKKSMAEKPMASPTIGPLDPLKWIAQSPTPNATVDARTIAMFLADFFATARRVFSQISPSARRTPGIKQVARKFGLPNGNLARRIGLRP